MSVVLRSTHSPGDLPGVWHADELAGGPVRALATGHAPLDAELPGGGWPLGAMTELLPTAQAPVWSLLLPALVSHWENSGEAVALIRPPHEPFMPGLAAAGLPAEAVLWIRAETANASLWAAEQSLRCAEVGAVVAWLPGARAVDLRRLQGAASRRADSLLFVLRPETAASSASPARVRMALRGMAVRMAEAPERSEKSNGVAPYLQVHILKRRGPPLTKPLLLQAHDERIRALLAAERLSQEMAGRIGAEVLPFAAPPGGQEEGLPESHSSGHPERFPDNNLHFPSRAHALDRVAVAA